MSDPINIDHLSLDEILSELYMAQKCTFFLEDMVGRVIDQMGLTDDEAIAVMKVLVEKGYVSTKSFLPATFLNHKYIRYFPVVLSSKAIALLKKNNQNKG